MLRITLYVLFGLSFESLPCILRMKLFSKVRAIANR